MFNEISLLENLEKTVKALDKPIEAGFFNCRTANKCLDDARNQPEPVQLYYDILIENELTILVADTGVGKSIYAVQIAHEISKTKKVLYFDLELSDKQFQKRYSENYENNFQFNDNFYRVDFKRRFTMPENMSYESYFLDSLKKVLDETGAKIVIIDNMTRLISSDTDKAATAKPLMDSLNDLKFDYNLTLLLLEHTKKVDNSRPIQLNDLQGSKMKSNFADAVFTIGRCFKDKNLRYVKKLKVRSGELLFDADNVILYEISKISNFLKLKQIGYANEFELLKQPSENDKANIIQEVRNLSQQGKSLRQIADEVGISKSSVERILKNN